METPLPYLPSQAQLHSQTFYYPSPPITQLSQKYNHTVQENAFLAAAPAHAVSQQHVPGMLTQANFMVLPPNHVAFQNNAATEHSLQVVSRAPMPSPQATNVANVTTTPSWNVGPQTINTAIVPSPRATNGAIMGTTAWTTGLFDCMEDPTNALTTLLFPCVTFGQIAEVLEGGHTTCATSGIIYVCAPCLMSRGYRRKLRQVFGLAEAPASDWLAHSLFEWCALCQEYRELNNRGINPALGWQGNVSKHQNEQNQFKMVPPTNQIMN